MRTSVIIPTFRRPQALTRCLDALAGQTTVADEILVVVRLDDEVSEQAIRGREEPIRLVWINVPPGRPGFVAALNAGVEASSGDVVCFTDDDAEPRPDWISQILAAFAADASVGAVGGRDWVHHGDRLEDGAEPVVGTVSWWGRVIGRHHLGVGPPRDVSVLKGANLSARGDLVREVGFDQRLLGESTEHHSELGLCLRLRRMGYRVIYDPAIAVDHRPQPRVAEARGFGPRQVRNAAHNETVALLEHLGHVGKFAHLCWSVFLGSRGSPGIGHAMGSLLLSGDPKFPLLCANLDGRRRAILTYQESRSRSRSSRAPTERSRAPKVFAIAHSAPAGVRAEQLLRGVTNTVVLVEPASDGRGLASLAWAVLRSGSDILYLVDVGKTTTLAGLLGRALNRRVIVDTGDACYSLARSLGDRTAVGLLSVRIGEQLVLRSADEIVVRGRAHAFHVPGRATHIPDIAPPGVGPRSATALRQSLGLDDRFVVGLVGSLIPSLRLGMSYGWDLIEALCEVDPEVVALVVGNGPGLPALRRRADELGVSDRCHFAGRVPVTRISEYVSAMDVAISTQTNDLVGQVRTTGKLPLYLACGTPVLASHVGEAALILGPLGWTVPYVGVLDHDYPGRLGTAIEAWRMDPAGAIARKQTALDVARQFFDEKTMRERLTTVIDRVSLR